MPSKPPLRAPDVDGAPDLMTSVAAVLEPLAGLLLSHQIRFAQAEELLKAAFVQACARAFAAQGTLPSVSTVSVATGIRRREVKRLVDAAAGGHGAAALGHRPALPG
jgi:hypothetical protein